MAFEASIFQQPQQRKDSFGCLYTNADIFTMTAQIAKDNSRVFFHLL
jgi:hypothetical protein